MQFLNELLASKAVIKGVLAGQTVVMVIYCVAKMITCSPMVGQYFDTMIVVTRVAITTHQNLSVGNCF